MKKRDLVEYAVSVAILLVLLAACQAMNHSYQEDASAQHAPIQDLKPLETDVDTSNLPLDHASFVSSHQEPRLPQLASFIWQGVKPMLLVPALGEASTWLQLASHP